MPEHPVAHCGYARVAIRELTPAKGSKLNERERAKQFCDLFSLSSFKTSTELFNKTTRVDIHSTGNVKNKWHPKDKRAEYTATFSIQNWKSLPKSQRAKHNCEGCYHAYKDLQEHFPGKPVFVAQPLFVQLPSTSRKDERILARRN